MIEFEGDLFSPNIDIPNSQRMMSVIEHVVLFRVKEDAARSEIDSMVERVNSLVSLEEPLHLNIGPLVSIRSYPSSSFNFTHILHSRFSSKDDLHAYAVHPTHVAVINVNAPLIADTMALDWFAEAHGAALVPPPGSALRVTFFKLKEGVGEQSKDAVLGTIREIQHEQAVQFTCGENFSPGRAKGFSIASLAVFPGLTELLAADSAEEIGNYHRNDKIKEHLESVLVLDYVPEGKSTSR